MEPLDCVVKLIDGSAAKSGTASSSRPATSTPSRNAVGLKPEQVKLNMLYAGGSFGRRANPGGDYMVEAVAIAKALAARASPSVPVKLVWTREDDMPGGYYRPAYYHTLKAGLDAARQRRRVAASDRRPVDPRPARRSRRCW